METNGEAKILRIYISNTDKFRHMPLYEIITLAAKRYHIAGVTVLKGITGYGSSSTIHNVKFWELTEKLPVVVEIVDEAEKIEQFVQKILPWFERLRYGCLISVQDINVILYKKGAKKS